MLSSNLPVPKTEGLLHSAFSLQGGSRQTASFSRGSSKPATSERALKNKDRVQPSYQIRCRQPTQLAEPGRALPYQCRQSLGAVLRNRSISHSH